MLGIFVLLGQGTGVNMCQVQPNLADIDTYASTKFLFRWLNLSFNTDIRHWYQDKFTSPEMLTKQFYHIR